MANDLIIRIEENYFHSMNNAIPFDNNYIEVVEVVERSIERTPEYIVIQKQINVLKDELHKLYIKQNQLKHGDRITSRGQKDS